jgi:cytochrome c oxidase cbb3-type subunit I/II
MIRPFRSRSRALTTWTNDKQYSKAGEYVYDHPFLWGSKRTGPDLHRLGGKYSDNWHFNHMYDPQSTSSGSIMPSYRWLIVRKGAELDKSMTEKKMEAMVNTWRAHILTRRLPSAQSSMLAQGTQIEKNLYSDPDFVATSYEADKAASGADFVEMKNREIVALIAYLQRSGNRY